MNTGLARPAPKTYLARTANLRDDDDFGFVANTLFNGPGTMSASPIEAAVAWRGDWDPLKELAPTATCHTEIGIEYNPTAVSFSYS